MIVAVQWERRGCRHTFAITYVTQRLSAASRVSVAAVPLCVHVMINSNTNPSGFLSQGPPHRCALFFVDNSGVDIILGVYPFVRELLSRGTEVRKCKDTSVAGPFR